MRSALSGCLAVLAGLLMLLGLQPASSAAPTYSAAVPAAASPSPTLGSTEQSNPNQPGPLDSDAADYSGAIWVVAGVGAVALIVGAGTLYVFRGRRRESLRP